MHDHLDPEKGEESGVQGVFINNNKQLVWAEHLPHRVAESVNTESFKINKCLPAMLTLKAQAYVQPNTCQLGQAWAAYISLENTKYFFFHQTQCKQAHKV